MLRHPMTFAALLLGFVAGAFAVGLARSGRQFIRVSVDPHARTVSVARADGEMIFTVADIPHPLIAISDLPVAGDSQLGDIAITDFDLGFLDDHFTLVVYGKEYWISNFTFAAADGSPSRRVTY